MKVIKSRMFNVERQGQINYRLHISPNMLSFVALILYNALNKIMPIQSFI